MRLQQGLVPVTIDQDYYARRLEEERARAREGGDASAIHAELADRYAVLLAKGKMPGLHDEHPDDSPLA